MIKRCSHCEQYKDTSEFSLRGGSRRPGSTNSWCKDCMRETLRERYAENPEPRKEAQKRYLARKKKTKTMDKWKAYKKPLFVSSYYEEA